MIQGGLPISVHEPMYRGDTVTYDKGLLTDLDKKSQELILEWIDKYIVPTKGRPWTASREWRPAYSYGIKHRMEDYSHQHGGVGYISNNQAKHAMMFKGYMPIDENAEPNWCWRAEELSAPRDEN